MPKEYHKNPRKITQQLLAQLKANLEELGDLSGITHDLNTDEIITGNQRSKVINLSECEIHLTKEFKKPDKQGTVALGYVIWQGMNLNYRQVRWDEKQREKANITANSLIGLWDEDVLKKDWIGVAEIEKWNLPFILETPPFIEGEITGSSHASNKYWGGKPIVLLSFNLVQRVINIPEAEAGQFIDGLHKIMDKKENRVEEFYNDVYHMAFDRMQELLTEINEVQPD